MVTPGMVVTTSVMPICFASRMSASLSGRDTMASRIMCLSSPRSRANCRAGRSAARSSCSSAPAGFIWSLCAAGGSGRRRARWSRGAMRSDRRTGDGTNASKSAGCCVRARRRRCSTGRAADGAACPTLTAELCTARDEPRCRPPGPGTAQPRKSMSHLAGSIARRSGRRRDGHGPDPQMPEINNGPFSRAQSSIITPTAQRSSLVCG